jgi:hypothetical protein
MALPGRSAAWIAPESKGVLRFIVAPVMPVEAIGDGNRCNYPWLVTDTVIPVQTGRARICQGWLRSL